MSQSLNQRNTKTVREARVDAESWPEWYAMSPLERWYESAKLWQFNLEAGGSLDPEPGWSKALPFEVRFRSSFMSVKDSARAETSLS